MYNGSALAWAAGGRQAFDGQVRAGLHPTPHGAAHVPPRPHPFSSSHPPLRYTRTPGCPPVLASGRARAPLVRAQNFLLRVSDPYDEYRASHGESGTFTLNKADGGDRLPDLERGDVQSGGRVYRYPHAPFTPLRYEARVPLPRLAMGTQGSDGKLFVKDTVLQVEELGNMYDDDCHKSLSTAKEGGTPWHFGDKCRSVIVSFAVKACREQPLQAEQQHCLAVGAYYDDTLGRDKCRAVQRLVGATILVRRSDVDSVTRGDGDKAVAGKSWRPAPGWCNDTRMCPTRGAGFSLQMADHSSVLTYGASPGKGAGGGAFLPALAAAVGRQADTTSQAPRVTLSHGRARARRCCFR